MSQYPMPPSYDGQYNYAPPWPVHLPRDSNDPNQTGAHFFAMNNAPIGIANFAGLPFGSATPIQLPGLGMAPNATFPPYQSQQFTNNQTPMPFYGAVDSPFDASNEPLHSTEENTVAQPRKKRKSLPVRPSSKSPKHPSPVVINDTDREEGEVSDGSSYDLSCQRSRHKLHSGKTTPLSRSQSALGTDTSLSQSQTPSHVNSAINSVPVDNSPPYNPPVTIETTEISQIKPKQADASRIEKGRLDNQSSYSQSSGKSPAQMRVMAQGALLSLAPHNIRFSELVKEDIDPTVLKQLYDDIGIKVTPTAEKHQGSAVHKPDVAKVEITQPVIEKLDPGAAAHVKLPTASSASAKPLERKDVIARMLAEKAKKKAANVVADSALDNGLTSAPGIEKAAEAPKPKLPVQTKEKNKALSELARQRMEQLKKMGLKRQQSNPESTNVSSTPVSSASNTPFAKPETTPSSIESRSMGTSTPFKNSLGKRPRASDFDEPIPETKKHSMTDRLVIDISDDESSDDEEDIEMSEASDPAMMNIPPSKAAESMPRINISRNASSASGTCQSRTSEIEGLRQKNLEIQAMRRRIAELEEKNAKKIKAALPTATVIENGSLSPATAIIGTENMSQFISNNAHTMTTPSDKSSPPRLQRSPSEQSLASMDNSDLDRIRQKLLRKRVIESGLPTLDAELIKFEAKLAEYKREEERLLSEIARSREERKKLGEELESLGMETEGLTLEELRAAKEDIERGTAVEAEPESLEVVPPESVPSSKTLQTASAVVDSTQGPQTLPLQSDSPIPELTLSEREEVNDAPEFEDSGMESSGSSMDESTSSSASSSMDQDSDSEPESEQAVELPLEPSGAVATQEAPAHGVPPVEAPQAASFIPMNLTSTEAPAVDIEPTMDMEPVVDVDHSASGPDASRESSILSDNYEPPEPEDSDEAYSPKLSPKDIEESEVESAPKITTLNDADMTLTRKPQDFVVIASKGDALDNTPQGGGTVSKFSPYQSPLKSFRAYRYHPNFVEDVKGGYRSLTYSHQINSQQAFCPYEAAGGVCNDATCEFQHWRDIVMPDDKILVDMGNQGEGKTTEEREAYIEGLKDLVNSMQRDQVKDFSTIAGEIAAYRRRFLSDPSRILPL
uniref:Protein red1 n=1 Tax=Talaromyces marneffei PM1 TaxID=1077442 RepID=A0A093V1J6_TALMA